MDLYAEPSLGLSYVTTIVLQSIAATAYLDCFLRQENMFTGTNYGSIFLLFLLHSVCTSHIKTVSYI